MSAAAAGADVAVVGAGIVGLATAYALLERGARPTVYEARRPGAEQSGGAERIFRHAHDDARLVALARESRAVFRDWEEQLGTELLSRDGALVLGARATARLAVLDEVGGVRARAVGPDEVAARLPLLAPFDGPALLEEDAGAIRAATAVDALGTALGERLVADEVLALWPTRAGTVEVRTGAQRREHDAAVVCAGRGTARLARALGHAIPARLAVHGRVTFAVAGDAPERLACLQDSSDAWGEPGTYAAPSPGNARFSLGVAGEVEAHEDGTLLDPAGLAAVTDRAAAYVRRALPGLDPQPVGLRHCWVSALPWHEDALAVWEADRVLLVAGGNLFKHAPALGRRLAAAALGERLAPELRPEARLGAPQGG